MISPSPLLGADARSDREIARDAIAKLKLELPDSDEALKVVTVENGWGDARRSSSSSIISTSAPGPRPAGPRDVVGVVDLNDLEPQANSSSRPSRDSALCIRYSG